MKHHLFQSYKWFLCVFLCLPTATMVEAKTYEIYPERFADA